jgi:hypothetical protein
MNNAAQNERVSIRVLTKLLRLMLFEHVLAERKLFFTQLGLQRSRDITEDNISLK